MSSPPTPIRPTGQGEPWARLEAELRGPVPAGIAALDGPELAHLADTVAGARHRQAAEIAAAADRSLRFVPRVLRTPLRKMLS